MVVFKFKAFQCPVGTLKVYEESEVTHAIIQRSYQGHHDPQPRPLEASYLRSC